MSFFLAVESLHLHRMKRTGWMQLLFVLFLALQILLVLHPIGNSDFGELFSYVFHPEQWKDGGLAQTLDGGNWLFLGIQQLLSAIGMMVGLAYTYLFLRDLPTLGREEESVQERFLKYYPESQKADAKLSPIPGILEPKRVALLIVGYALLATFIRMISALFFMIPYVLFIFWSYYWLPCRFFSPSFPKARWAAWQTLKRSWVQIFWGMLFLFFESQFLSWLLQSGLDNPYWVRLSQGFLMTFFACARGRLRALLFLGYGRLSQCAMEGPALS